MKSPYHHAITGELVNAPGERATVIVDVYDVLNAFPVECPALQHLIKKALVPGRRGHKDIERDLKDIIWSAERALTLHHDREARAALAMSMAPSPAMPDMSEETDQADELAAALDHENQMPAPDSQDDKDAREMRDQQSRRFSTIELLAKTYRLCRPLGDTSRASFFTLIAHGANPPVLQAWQLDAGTAWLVDHKGAHLTSVNMSDLLAYLCHHKRRLYADKLVGDMSEMLALWPEYSLEINSEDTGIRFSEVYQPHLYIGGDAERNSLRPYSVVKSTGMF